MAAECNRCMHSNRELRCALQWEHADCCDEWFCVEKRPNRSLRCAGMNQYESYNKFLCGVRMKSIVHCDGDPFLRSDRERPCSYGTYRSHDRNNETSLDSTDRGGEECPFPSNPDRKRCPKG